MIAKHMSTNILSQMNQWINLGIGREGPNNDHLCPIRAMVWCTVCRQNHTSTECPHLHVRPSIYCAYCQRIGHHDTSQCRYSINEPLPVLPPPPPPIVTSINQVVNEEMQDGDSALGGLLGQKARCVMPAKLLYPAGWSSSPMFQSLTIYSRG